MKKSNCIYLVLVNIALFLLCLSAAKSLAQNTSNKGKDFWLGFGNHQRGFDENVNTQEMVLYITSDVDTHGEVEIPGLGPGATLSFTVSANSITQVPIDKRAYLKDEGLYPTGIHVTAEKPVVVYAHIYNESVSGASLVLPTNVLGKEYYSINYKQVSNQDTAFSYFFVVAIEDDTEVEITPSANTRGGYPAGKPFFKRLRKGEIYQVLGAELPAERVNVPGGFVFRYRGEDLTGSTIRSISTGTAACKRIAVFSGSSKMSINCDGGPPGSGDNLFQQVYPLTSWGKRVITVPLSTRDYDIIRVVKSNPASTLKVNGVEILSAGDRYEFSTRVVNVIECDFPIQVVQYAVSQGSSLDCAGVRETVGDPEMIYLNPIEQNIDHITVFSASQFRIRSNYINVVIETSSVNGFLLDGTSRASEFRPVPGDPNYSYAQLSVGAGVHTLSAPTGFNAVAYGFGPYESYGYSAGTNVKGQELKALNKISNKTVSSGCVNEPFRFSIGLPAEVRRITWNLGNGEPPVTLNYTRPEEVYDENGKTLYLYSIDRDVTYTSAGDYAIEVTAEKTSSDGCGNTEIIQFDFSVFDPPLPKFTVDSYCQNTDIQFKDESDGNGRNIESWYWEFGDGNYSSEQYPKHSYSEPGEYTVSLTITTESGCSPAKSAPVTLKIYKTPEVNFSSSLACETQKVVFTDLSAAEEANIIQWIWTFGDGSTETRTNNQPVEHTYADAGTYSVGLNVLTDKGCEQEKFISITVNPAPKVDFLLPEVCLDDAFASFTDQSSISDNSESEFSYEWDFGDLASGSLNTSREKNPQHKYSRVGEYTVSLTVTSASGCRVSRAKKFYVNGSNPRAGFDVLDPDDLCSRSPVNFVNTSTVAPGKITRLEWYFDWGSAPGDKVVDEDPEPGKIQSHKYPEFSDPVTKSYQVRLLAFSGGTCVDEKIATITLKAMPVAKLEATDAICLESPAIQLQAGEEKNLDGTKSFTGRGISNSGLFDPMRAGPGVHEIRYIFTASNGCADTITRNITVHPSPNVSAGNELFIREGASVRINAKADADIVKYEWFPAEGLDRTDIRNPVASPSDNTTYTLKVTNSNGCTATSSVRVRVDRIPVIPNSFTPNGDNINDIWNIRHLDRYPGARVDVFNRYGKRVYTSRGYSEPWDGTENGSPLPSGVYYYIIDLKNGVEPYKGYISIIR